MPQDPEVWRHQMAAFMAAHALEGDVLFVKLAGSRGYNLALPDSDCDYVGVFASPIDTVLSLAGPPASVQAAEGTKPDFTAHEARRMAALLLKGNMNAIETLFTRHHAYASEAWRELVRQRMAFVTAVAVRQCLGYAQGHIRQIQKGGTPQGPEHLPVADKLHKRMYHVHRLLYAAQDMAAGRPPMVWFEGERRDHILRIRRGEVGRDELLDSAAALVGALEAAKPWPIPDKPDAAVVERWLLQLRHAAFGEGCRRYRAVLARCTSPEGADYCLAVVAALAEKYAVERPAVEGGRPGEVELWWRHRRVHCTLVDGDDGAVFTVHNDADGAAFPRTVQFDARHDRYTAAVTQASQEAMREMRRVCHLTNK